MATGKRGNEMLNAIAGPGMPTGKNSSDNLSHTVVNLLLLLLLLLLLFLFYNTLLCVMTS
jgi:hypothetical protein